MAADNIRRYSKIKSFYPETGPLRRDLYPKHIEFFIAGKFHSERAVIAANRVGKSEGIGGYETTLHLTGEYPDWWPGYKFDRPIKCWVAGDTSNTVRDILQNKLLGPIGDFGVGLIPKKNIRRITWKRNVPDAVNDIYVRHKSGGESHLLLKSYDQKRESFQGTEQDLIWLDEEPDMDIYSECLLRTMTTGGLVMCTFTPLKGLSDVVRAYMPGGRIPSDQASVIAPKSGISSAIDRKDNPT